MARITVEDCLEKIDSQYDLVLLAKERTSQLNAGDPALVPQDNDKISIKTLEDSAINRLRKQQEETTESEDELEDVSEDNFDKIYKGEVSKSGTAILPSKRIRRIPEKINFTSKNQDTEIEEDDESKQQEEKEAVPADQKSEK